MTDTLALLIPILAVSGLFAFLLSLSPVGRALADRIRHGPARRESGGDAEEALAALADLRREVAELAERVDFTERLVAQVRQARQLPGP